MWTHLGISEKLHEPVNKIPYPTFEDGHFLSFLCDVPHIVKCVRNHLLAHTYAMAGSNSINFKHYEHLYDAEKDSHLKIVPKLTSSHVKPSKLEKMSVRLAAQWSGGPAASSGTHALTDLPGIRVLFHCSALSTMNVAQRPPGTQQHQDYCAFHLQGVSTPSDALNDDNPPPLLVSHWALQRHHTMTVTSSMIQ
ncbi:hypothetical protein HPB51_021696 [Rhipicephalus microplus]|uniref:Transposable element P transposase-like GTP-binding insertion domain-containing protein n=1 Tax=Rhipicephalus microplus TaxID=6941 RepID=A0A9J6D776_RHIMP|nr:hypothetical protein HPB51_021696 [Rhipicephalus microplus]